jgi:phosphoglycolate phosphatase-like HAD superfamily hydrolase
MKSRPARALIFDLDGTLVDTVYAHVFAWQRAFAELGLPIDGWRIHRRMGMSGGLFARAAAREIGRPLSPTEAETIQRRHGEIYREILPERRQLPGASSCSPTRDDRASAGDRLAPPARSREGRLPLRALLATWSVSLVHWKARRVEERWTG